MANNTWKNYTQKSIALSDNDEVMLLDSTDEKNKRGLMSKFWDYVVDKMSTAVISKLETENKTVIGALNYLNGNLSKNLNGTTWYNGNNTSIFDILSPREGAGVYSIYSATDFPTTEGYGFIIKGCERMIFIDAKGLYYAVANRGEWVRSWSKL